MNEQIGNVGPVPSWLLVRYVAVATELERMHGTIFATEFLHDVGITPGFDSGDSERRSLLDPVSCNRLFRWHVGMHASTAVSLQPIFAAFAPAE